MIPCKGYIIIPGITKNNIYGRIEEVSYREKTAGTVDFTFYSGGIQSKKKMSNEGVKERKSVAMTKMAPSASEFRAKIAMMKLWKPTNSPSVSRIHKMKERKGQSIDFHDYI